MLRRLLPERMTLWLVASKALTLTLVLERQGERSAHLPLDEQQCRRLSIGTHAVVHMIDVAIRPAFDEGEVLSYDLLIEAQGASTGMAEWAPQLCLEGERRPRVRHSMTLVSIAHGSCRRPHFDAPDGLARLDRQLNAQRSTPEQWPSLLMMTGDQIYADDVAGPMLLAINALVSRLGLYHERFDQAEIDDSQALMEDPWLYRRHRLLPATSDNRLLQRYFFRGKQKPIFTAAGADNHLISLGEILAMYLLVWSEVPWQLINVTPPALEEDKAALFKREQAALAHFVEELPAVRRVMAHLPVYMIFDDHDVTDDWNLTAQWERTALEHPFSRRIMGNALMGYLICQGWGNAPEHFDGPMMTRLETYCRAPEEAHHSAMIEALFRFEHWHYSLPTHPAMVVLDTRTRRWRSENGLHKPSGLMDWEALTELQQELMGHDAVIMVSAAPVFGVKLIEIVQRVFVWFNRPLLVDAENWMSHRGAAYVMLNIFRHRNTPQNFVVLSGDVHYSFAYDVQLRGQHRSPDIWQVTSSGIRNQFPDRLLDIFDRINRWLFAPWSPVNWLTKRRYMVIRPRQPDNRSPGERLVNKAGIGLLYLDDQGRPRDIIQLGGDDQDVRFERDDP
ncbi:alkaline phosphatase family protein [Kushneria avicenniae]|nr:alkaline phosphatase family protein [Kushneria avicenniae]